MKILHINNTSEHSFNGIDSVLLSLIPAQRNLGHEVISASVNSHGGKNCYEQLPTIKIFIEYLEKYRPDIVIFHGLFIFKYVILAYECKRINIAYAFVLHGAGSKVNMDKNYWRKKIASLLIFKPLLNSANGIIFLNKGEQDSNIICNDNNRQYIIPNGVEKVYNNLSKQCNEKLRIIFLGRIEPIHKGVDKLLESLYLLKEQEISEQIEVKFYGPIQYDGFLELIKPLCSFVKWEGIVRGEEKIKVLNESDIHILTSRFEGMPMSVLEALSCGLPCIVTPGTNMSDMIEDHNVGWVTDVNAESIASTLLIAIEEFKINREKYIQNAYKSVSPYLWSNIAHKSIDTYKSICQSGL